MKAILLTAFMTFSIAANASTNEMQDAQSALRDATHEQAVARQNWDAAVAGGHPVPAGQWAQKHFKAMQKVKAAQKRLEVVAKRETATKSRID